MPAPTACPGAPEIERIASGEPAEPALAVHVASCAACRERLEAAREDAHFLARVRTLTGDEIGPDGAPHIPGYRTQGVISAGAQGVVYRAVQESTSRTVAIKTLRTGADTTERQRYRAEREAEIAARLRHPNVVSVFESRVLPDGRIAVVMEFVDGVALDQWRPPGSTPDARQRALLKVFIAVCQGVQAAHLSGVIHRDLKPENVLVTAQGRPVVLDFGIARVGAARMTLTGEFAGTPAYSSPEQVSGKPEEVDALTDVYSLGVILYRLLCAEWPYDVQGSLLDVVRAITESPPIPPRRRAPGISPDLEAIVLKALRKDKALRYQSAAGLARDIERYLSGSPVDARSGSGWYLLRKAVLLNRRRLGWAAAAATLLIASLVAVALSISEAAREREQARAENVRARAVAELLREALPSEDPQRPGLAAAVGAGLARLYLRLETGAFAADPEMDQSLRRLWGSIYTDLGAGKVAGLIEYSEVSLRSGLARLRAEHGGEHPEIAATLHELAGVLLARQRAPEALGVCSEALRMRERLLGAESLPAAETRALLARVQFTLGDAGSAARNAERALGVFRGEEVHGTDPQIAAMVALLGKARMSEGDFAGAEPLVRDALCLRLRTLPPEDPDLHASISDGAEIAAALPDSPLGVAACEAWGAGGVGVRAGAARALVSLRVPAYGDKSRAQDAQATVAALDGLLVLQRALLGESDAALVGTHMARLRAAIEAKDYDARSASALAAAALLEQRFGPDSSEVRVCMEQAAVSLAFSGRSEEAIRCARRVCDSWDAQRPEHRDALMAASARRWLAWYLALAERCEESIAEYRRAIDEFVAVVGEEHHTVALSRAGLAYCLWETGAVAEAEALSQGALAMGRRLSATPADQMAILEFVRAHMLVAGGQFAEARGLMDGAWTRGFAHTDANFPWFIVFVEDMAAACEGLGDEAATLRWRAMAGTQSQ